jgi:hypothetical protein
VYKVWVSGNATGENPLKTGVFFGFAYLLGTPIGEENRGLTSYLKLLEDGSREVFTLLRGLN